MATRAEPRLLATFLGILCVPAYAGAEREAAVHHAFRLEAGAGWAVDGQGYADWDLDGWMGTDENKVRLKLEGERSAGDVEQATFWASYSRNIATFWDAQIGVRHDTRPDSLIHGVMGLAGLAPFFFETEAHLFLSEEGDLSARIRQENDLLLTQKWIAQPYLEVHFSARDVPESDVGAGLSSGELGVQMRYEFTRGFAPYVDVRYRRRFGKTSSLAGSSGADHDAVAGTVGIRFLF